MLPPNFPHASHDDCKSFSSPFSHSVAALVLGANSRSGPEDLSAQGTAQQYELKPAKGLQCLVISCDTNSVSTNLNEPERC